MSKLGKKTKTSDLTNKPRGFKYLKINHKPCCTET